MKSFKAKLKRKVFIRHKQLFRDALYKGSYYLASKKVEGCPANEKCERVIELNIPATDVQTVAK